MSENPDRLTPEQRRQAEKLFAELEGMPPSSRFEAITNSDCDEDVRREVRTRISSIDVTLDDSSSPQFEDVETASRPGADTPSIKMIGNYRIRRLIGVGGMGQVFEAMQDHPRRPVALKVMRAAIASETGRRRFEYEVQILGRLRHPNIAQIYDADVWNENGSESPYFVMEYVAGKPIDEHVKESSLDLDARLRLFLEVCDAISHGHERGIIHRDLKPGNILVDGAGHAKVIDFGVARATDSDLRATEVQTAVGQLIGTLQYMSPEQCAADPSDIDIRSDVYALGVVLFELLSDRLPYDIGTGGIPEAVRVIMEDAPTRLTTLDGSMPRDVEVIVAKALEKERDRRYRSAGELGDDIRRYLNDEAIVARPPSLSEHIRRYARKHRAVTSAVVFTSIVLVVSVIMIVYFAVEASRQREIAQQEAEAALAARAEAVVEAERANLNFSRLRGVFGELFGDLQVSVRNLAGGDTARQIMVRMGREQIQQLRSVASEEERSLLRPELARSHEALGDLLGGERTANLGRPDDALAEYRAAERIWRSFAGEGASDDVVVDLARILRKQSDLLRASEPARARALLDDARPMLLRSLEARPEAASLMRQHYFALEALGNLLCEDETDVDAMADALPLFIEFRDLASRLTARYPDDIRYQRDLGLALRKTGWAHSRLGDLDDAERVLRDSVEQFERNAVSDPENIRHRRDIGWGCWYLAEVLVSRRKYREGGDQLARCASFLVLACSLQPSSADYRSDVADVLPVVHQWLIDLEFEDLANTVLDDSLLTLQPVAEAEPENIALERLMGLLRALGQSKD
jgi:serine/threonine protein kinase